MTFRGKRVIYVTTQRETVQGGNDMSCVKVTPRPSYYARLEELPPEPEPILTGRVTI